MDTLNQKGVLFFAEISGCGQDLISGDRLETGEDEKPP
jgi:hypothetical protein